ncbi:MAG TPA: AMP-binding protein [Gemmatimonadaceae bacterium]
MSDWRLELYHHLPTPARAVAAGARGWYLRAWRYGPETERLVAEALERERWSAERWRAWREERLAMVLHRAATRVPYYREQWAARRRRGDRAGWERLEHWPVLEKEAVRRDARAFVADDRDPRRMFHEHTSGTTGTSLDLWWSRETVRAWYALFEARWRRWYGVSRRDRWAILGGQLVVPVTRRAPPFWVWNPALRQLYLSSYHLAPDLVPHYVDAIRRHRVRYLWGYPSALHALAVGAERAGGIGRALGLRVAIANAEPVLPHQREAVERAFACPLRETYGMAEIVAAAGECEYGALHLWPEAGLVEVLDGESPVAAGETGDLVCTGLANPDMPLVRYRLGDRGAIGGRLSQPRAESRSSCPCGRTLPRLARLEGRSDDVLYTRDGRAVGRMDPVFKSRLPVLEAQIVQETLDRVRVRYVPAPEWSAADGEAIVERIRDRLGDVEVRLEPVAAIARDANGKLRAVVCALPAEERERSRAAGA